MAKLLEYQVLPPLVVDADGLNLLAEMPEWQRRLAPETISDRRYDASSSSHSSAMS